MGLFDKAIERLATAITKASPSATPIPQHMMNQQQSYGNTVPLPREGNLASVPFAPGNPLLPGAINPVRADGRPDPRRYEFQVAQNINITPTRLIPFQTLRSSADQIDILRRCIEVIKQKMVGLDWDIVLGEDAVEKVMAETGEKSNLRAMQLAKDKYNDEINRMRQFWKTPDVSNGLLFADWLNMALEEVLVLDAWAVWPQATVGGDILGLQILDGSTIKPLIDDRGMRPLPPNAAFQQILYGFPRSEFSAPVESEEADGEFLSDELQYMVRNRRTNTVYGFSPVERSLTLADIYLRRQQWLRAEYTDGVLPELLFTSTADFGNNPDLLKAYENVFNDDLAGDTAQRKRARILPTGLEPVQFDGYGEKFKDVLDEYLVNSICGHFGVLPTEIGFAPKTGLGGSGFQDGQAESSEVIGVMPLANWTARMLSNLSYVFLGMPRELEFKFQPSGRSDSAGLAAEVDIKRKNGGLTLNEARSREGLPLIEAPEADQPMIVTPAGVFFVTDEGLVPISEPEAPVAPGEEVEEPEESGAESGVQEAEADDDAKKALGASSASNLVSGEITKYDPNQPRDPKGRFGSAVGNLASQAESGFSVRATDFKTPTRGYMVARPEGGVVIDAPDLESTKQGLKDFMAQNKDRFAQDPTLYIGGWKDSNTGKLYLELSDNVASKRIATELGTRRDQVAVWDVVGSREIGTGGTGGANAEPGTSAHPDDLYGAGTVIRKGAFGLLRVVGSGAGQGSGSTGEGNTGLVADLEKKYNPGQARDKKGRWTSGSRVGMGDVTVNDEDFAAMQQGSAGAFITGRTASGQPIFNEERQALHDKIVEDSLEGIPVQEDPTFYMMGGGPASGKSSMLRTGKTGIPVNDSGDVRDAVEVNPDLYKEKLPEYGTMVAAKNPAAASFTHEESSYLAKRVQAAGIERGMDVVVDGVGDSGEASVGKKVMAAKKAGYKTVAVYATIPTEVAIERSDARAAKTGRVVPHSYLTNAHANVSKVFPFVAKTFDEVKLFDNLTEPRVIATAKNGKLSVVDDAAYSSFLAKGD